MPPKNTNVDTVETTPAITLTETDRGILKQLTIDPLASNRAIAEVLGISTSQVAARMRWLDKKQVARIIAVLDLTAAGQTFCFIKVSVRGRPVDQVAIGISQIRQTLYVSALDGGADDLLVLLRFFNRTDLNALLYQSLASINGVYRFKVSTVLDIPLYRPESVTFMPHFRPMDVQDNIREIKADFPDDVIDSLDRCIIAELQQDGRKSINDIARRYDINPGTMRYRVKNLESRGLLRFITLFDPVAIGVNNFALVEIDVATNCLDSVVKQLKNIGELDQVFICAGGTPIVFLIQAVSATAIQRIKRESITTITGVLEVLITPIGFTYKMDQRWGQRFTEGAGD